MTPKEQKILNAQIRLALRTGQLPFTFEDEQEKRYRQLVFEMSKETGIKYKVNKVGKLWSIDLS
jgi:hypothetical protein